MFQDTVSASYIYWLLKHKKLHVPLTVCLRISYHSQNRQEYSPYRALTDCVFFKEDQCVFYDVGTRT
jgi:hypothetical protein